MALFKDKDKLLIVPLGGLGEIGKNMTVIRYKDNILVVDAGLAFPEEEMLGVDMVIPDITYLKENADKVRAILVTHGHEDHIGALPYVLRTLNVPVYGTRLTLGLVKGKLSEHNLENEIDAREVKAGDHVKIGCFRVEFFTVNHSVADAVGLAIHTPVGTVLHTGDFKLDQTPVDGKRTDFHKLAQLGEKGVLALLSDSTNADRSGYTPSEKRVGEALDSLFAKCQNRILVASFASHVLRLQQVITTAHRYGRKVAVVGRSMENVVQIAMSLGYLEVPEDTLATVEETNKMPPEKVVILTTGSQGEPMSALSRISNADHKRVEIIPGDVVIIAATPVPGNETMVSRTVDNLFRRGAQVVYQPQTGVHVSGHASREELKIMLSLVKPKFFIPVHGEYRHLVHHSELAQEMGIPRDHIFIAENGSMLEFTSETAALASKVPGGSVLVDGLGVGDVGNVVLRDRKQLSEDGIFIIVVAMDRENAQIIAGPEVVSRGFVYVKESETLIEEAKSKIKTALDNCAQKKMTEWSAIKGAIREVLSKYLYEKVGRRPMIIPIIIEV